MGWADNVRALDHRPCRGSGIDATLRLADRFSGIPKTKPCLKAWGCYQFFEFRTRAIFTHRSMTGNAARRMPDLLFVCPHCGQTFETLAELTGQEMSCPHCEGRVSISIEGAESFSPSFASTNR